MNNYKLAKNIFATVLFLSAIWLLLFNWSNAGKLSLKIVEPKKDARMSVKNRVCYVNYNDSRAHVAQDSSLKMIYYVTPTYPRPEQMPELTRLAHTLMHVPRIHWLVADDQPICSGQVLSLLKRSGLPFTHISSPKPYLYEVKNVYIARGVANRLATLDWLREQNVSEGVVYFGDDDNTVDLQLFQEIRSTKKVSMFPVGLVGEYGVSTPVVKNGKVIGFFDSWLASRQFPVDMAGFAVNVEFLKETADMPFIAGHEEDGFLGSLGLDMNDIEPLADNCTKILVWHTQSTKHKKATLKIDIDKLESMPKYHNLATALKEIVKLGMADLNSDSGVKAHVTRNRKIYDTLSDLR